MVRKPNEQWLTDLADDSRRELVRFLAARLPNAFDAEDLVQEVFLRLMRIEDTSTIRDGRAFALRVAANVAHEWRALARNRLAHSDDALAELAGDSPGPLDSLMHRQEMQRLSRVLDGMSPMCRAVVLLHRRDGLTYEQIATHVGISVGMVAKYLARGLLACQAASATEGKP
jgi:RNA polymerase sigma factor (sigma-70 family)